MKSINKIKSITIAGLCWVLLAVQAAAQCPMCKASVEANLKDGGSAGMGLNAGIIYLFLTPFAIIVTIAVTWFLVGRRNQKKAQLELEMEQEQLVY